MAFANHLHQFAASQNRARRSEQLEPSLYIPESTMSSFVQMNELGEKIILLV
jgi:hypothetical protein